MKKIYEFCCLFVCCILLASCGEEKKQWDQGIAPGPVTDVSATADNGTVILQWKNPADAGFYYVSIEYTGTDGTKLGRNISKFAEDPVTGFTTETIAGLGDTREYIFILKAHSEGGAASEPVEISAAPLSPVFDVIIENIKVEPDFGGAKITWENPTGKIANVVLEWVVDGRVERNTIEANASGSKAVAGMPEGTIVLKVYATDAYQNKSEIKEFTLTPYKEVEFDKSDWSVPGYDENSSEGTIGYSSQASIEGDPPKGRVIAVYDGVYDTSNTVSFWSTLWYPQLYYPHWLIIDLGRESVISRIELMGRIRSAGKADNRAQKGLQFLTCTAAGAIDPDNSEVWQWEDQGTYTFKNTEADTQRQSYRLTNNPEARYVKLYFPESMKGSGDDAMLGEMWVYGSDE